MHKILTGKCKRTFLKWLKIRVNSKLHEIDKIEFWFNLQDESFKIALIIEWFDSIANLHHNGAVYNFKTLYLSTFKQLEKHHSILDIQKIAIKKANEIYNSK